MTMVSSKQRPASYQVSESTLTPQSSMGWREPPGLIPSSKVETSGGSLGLISPPGLRVPLSSRKPGRTGKRRLTVFPKPNFEKAMAENMVGVGSHLFSTSCVVGSYRGPRGSPGGTPWEPPGNSTPEAHKRANII